MHDDDADVEAVERELRAHGFLRPGIDVDLDALHAFLAPLAEPSRWNASSSAANGCARRPAASPTRASNITRRFNLPPSYVLIHRVSTAGIGVLCQLECEGEFRAEVLRWVPSYFDPAVTEAADLADPGDAAVAVASRPERPRSGPARPKGAPGRRGRGREPVRGGDGRGRHDRGLRPAHPDITFASPAVFQPYRGRTATLQVLAAVARTFEDFAYTGETQGRAWTCCGSAAGWDATSSRASTSSPPTTTARSPASPWWSGRCARSRRWSSPCSKPWRGKRRKPPAE